VTAPSYPPGYPAPGPRPRPGTVTVASYLLYLVAGLEVIRAIVALATFGATSKALTEVYAGTAMADSAKTISLVGSIGAAVLGLLLGAGLVVLGLLNGKGKNASRIITWVLGGLSLCCLGADLGGGALTRSLESGSSGSTAGGPSTAEVQQRMDAATPSWAGAVTTTATVLILLAVLGAVILLALPASNEFFRKPAPGGFDPAAPYPYPYQGQAYPSPYPAPGYNSQPSPYGPQGRPGDPAPGLPPYPGQVVPGQPPFYPGQPDPGQPPFYSGQPGPGQPPFSSGQPGPGEPPSSPPPYPGQPLPGPGQPPYPGQNPPPASDPFAPPPSSGDEPPRPPTGNA
jgi:hypothetical protein